MNVYRNRRNVSLEKRLQFEKYNPVADENTYFYLEGNGCASVVVDRSVYDPKGIGLIWELSL